ncbi:MAG: VOC family protein [Planctomycetota bacterium]|nr:MAG: VOC family protein [Planctomycetota bacterium]
MLTNANLIAFIAVTDAATTRSFYRDLLGLSLVSDEPHALVFDAAGTMLRAAIVGQLAPAPHTVLGWEVPDIAAIAGKLTAAGIAPVPFAGLEQDAHGIWSAPGGAKVLWFNDPDGNVLSVTQFTRQSG